jgi:L-alanine-DL-glutamate epimerase-like enolase superfamily enzyme
LIKEIFATSTSIPLTKTEPEQLWTEEWSNQIFVKIQTSDDLTGWGEVLPAGGNLREPYVALIKLMRQNLIGKDETKYQDLWNLMRKMTFTGGYGITTGAISGIDLGIWDILGKRAKLPVCEMLGSRDFKVRRYVSLSRYGHVMDLKKLFNKLFEKGYRAIKLHQAPSETMESMRLVRNEFGDDFELMVDLNCGFNYDRARDFMAQAQRYELKWIEEPLWPPDDFEGLAKLNKLGPVAAGENFFSFFEFKRLLELDALTYYQPDVAKVGGVTPILEILKLLEDKRAKVAFHNRPHNGWIGVAASSHVACASKEIDCIVETPPNEIPTENFSLYPLLSKDDIQVIGPGFGIAPIEPLPEATESKLLEFHEL